MSQPGMVSHGLPPRDNEMAREIADIRREMRQTYGALARAFTKQITTAGGLVVDGGTILIKDGNGNTLFNFGQFISEYLSGLVGSVTVQGLQQKTPTGVLLFETWYDPTYAANGWFQVGDPYQTANRPNFGVYSHQTNIEGVSTVMLACGNESITIDDADGVQFQTGGAGYTFSGVPTSAATANVVLDASTGALTRSTSSRRYKQDIVDADLDPDVLLELTPRRFRAKTEVEAQGDDAPDHVGFIAEEAAELGLDDFVTHDELGPEAFSYAGYVVGLQAIVRHQAKQIESLSARLERLEQAEPHEEG